MVFSSGVFMFLFLPGLLLMYYLAKNRALRNLILLAASLLFYAWGEPVFVFIMLGSIFANWFITLLMSKSSRPKLWLTLSITLDVLLLGVFKYAGFICRKQPSVFLLIYILYHISVMIQNSICQMWFHTYSIVCYS